MACLQAHVVDEIYDVVPPASGICVPWGWPFVPRGQTLTAVASPPTVTLRVKRVLLQISRTGDGRTTRRYGWCLAGILHHEIRAIGCAPYHGYFQCGLNGEQKCIEGSTQRSIKPLLTTETGKLDFPQSLPYSSSYSSAYSSLASSSSSWSLLLALDEAAASSASLSSSRAELSDEWSES